MTIECDSGSFNRGDFSPPYFEYDSAMSFEDPKESSTSFLGKVYTRFFSSPNNRAFFGNEKDFIRLVNIVRVAAVSVFFVGIAIVYSLPTVVGFAICASQVFHTVSTTNEILSEVKEANSAVSYRKKRFG